jgi:hypothetical protein
MITQVALGTARPTVLSPDFSAGHLLLQTAVWLAVIVGALFALKWVSGRRRGSARSKVRGRGVRGTTARAFPRGPATAGLEIIDRQPIGKGQWIAVVEAEGQRFLVGMSGAGFTALGELKADGAAGGDAASVLDAMLGATRVPVAAVTGEAGAPGRSLLERARDVTVRR